MLKQQILIFLLRWLVSSLGMWICITLFGSSVDPPTPLLFLIAGLIFSLVNTIVKPIATLFALPLILLTLGLFVLILNTAMVGLTIWLLPTIHITFGGAILSALTMSVINYLANVLMPVYNKKQHGS